MAVAAGRGGRPRADRLLVLGLDVLDPGGDPVVRLGMHQAIALLDQGRHVLQRLSTTRQRRLPSRQPGPDQQLVRDLEPVDRLQIPSLEKLSKKLVGERLDSERGEQHRAAQEV